jgi:hypothetical protein
VKRDVVAILAAHRLDPARRELYVEGHRDRMVLLWLVGADLHENSRIVEVRFVDVNVDTGGERGRLLKFAAEVEGDPAQIRALVDADFDRLLGMTVPSNVWLTDRRDLEGYVLREDCLDKVFRLAASTDQVNVGDILRALTSAARRLSALRVMSARTGLDLPFQKTPLAKHVAATKTGFTLDIESYLRVLLQNGGVSLSRYGAIYSESLVSRSGS